MGSTFNDNDEVYHPFDKGDMKIRDKWEIAKIHIANVNNNHFTTRIHLGILHYASATFTTAFVNLAKQNKSLKWMKD